MAAADQTAELELSYTVGGVDIPFRYGRVLHAPGALYGVVMIPTRVGQKFVGAYRRSERSTWRRMGRQWNDPERALAQARERHCPEKRGRNS